MKNLMIGAAALLAALAAAPGAASAATGYIDADIGQVQADFGGGDEDDTNVGGIGGTAVFDMQGLKIQADGFWRRADADGGGGDTDLFGADAHLFAQNAQMLYGGFIGLSRIDDDGPDESDAWTGGGEVQFYGRRTTYGLAVVYADATDLDLSALSAEGDIKHFYTDNAAVSANAAFGNADEDGGDDSNFWSAGLGGEFQFAEAPLSIYIGYQHTEFDDFDVDFDAFGAGVRYNWGGTLFDRNRSGGDLRRRAGFGGLFAGFAA